MEQKFIFVLIIFLLIPFVLAEEISLDFPDEVNFNEEFEVKLSLVGFNDDVYDVKIDILDSSGKRIAQIYDGTKFKSTYYYINDIIKLGEEKSFNLKITEQYEGRASLSVLIRNSKEKINKFLDYELEVVGGSADNNTNDTVEQEEEKDVEQSERDKQLTKEEESIEKINDSKQELKVQKNEIIKLNSITQENSKIYKSKNEYIKEYSIYSFTILLAIIAVLLLIKTNKKN